MQVLNKTTGERKWCEIDVYLKDEKSQLGILIEGSRTVHYFESLGAIKFGDEYELVNYTDKDVERFENYMLKTLRVELEDEELNSIQIENGLYYLMSTTSEDEKYEYHLAFDFNKGILVWLVDDLIIFVESWDPFELVDECIESLMWSYFNDDDEVNELLEDPKLKIK